MEYVLFIRVISVFQYSLLHLLGQYNMHRGKSLCNFLRYRNHRSEDSGGLTLCTHSQGMPALSLIQGLPVQAEMAIPVIV